MLKQTSVCILLTCVTSAGHDDAIAILMALYEPTIELIGLSTVGLAHGIYCATSEVYL